MRRGAIGAAPSKERGVRARVLARAVSAAVYVSRAIAAKAAAWRRIRPKVKNVGMVPDPPHQMRSVVADPLVAPDPKACAALALPIERDSFACRGRGANQREGRKSERWPLLIAKKGRASLVLDGLLVLQLGLGRAAALEGSAGEPARGRVEVGDGLRGGSRGGCHIGWTAARAPRRRRRGPPARSPGPAARHAPEPDKAA